MTENQREAMMEANVSPELMTQIEKHVKEKCRVHPAEKANHLENELIDDALSFIDDNSDATIEDIIEELGTAESYETHALKNVSDNNLSTIKKRIQFRKIILIASVLVVVIVGAVYSTALILQNRDAPGTYEESLSGTYESVENESGEIE